MRLLALAAAAAVAATLAGCTTTLSTLPDNIATSTGDALPGAPYALPMARYDVTYTWSLTKCPTVETTKIAEGDFDVLTSPLVFSRKVEAVLSYGPGERYIIDYRALQAPFKTSGFTIVPNANGTLKSVNASADDQSGEAIKAAVKLGLTVATLTTGSPVAAAALAAAPAVETTTTGQKNNTPRGAVEAQGPIKPPKLSKKDAALRKTAIDQLTAIKAAGTPLTYVGCTRAAKKVLADVRAAGDKLDTATGDLNTATAKVNRLTVVANLKRATYAEVQALNGAITAQDEAKDAVTAQTDAKGEAVKKVTVSGSTTWPTTFSDHSAPLALEVDDIAAMSAHLRRYNNVTALTLDALVDWKEGLDEPTLTVLERDSALKTLLGKIPAKAPSPPDPACEGDQAGIDVCVATQTAVFMQFQLADAALSACSDAESTDPAKDCLRSRYILTQDEPRKALNAEDEPQPGETPTPAPNAVFGRTGRDRIADEGVFVRQPARARLFVCLGALKPGPVDLTSEPCLGRAVLLRSDPVSTPQLGQLRFLPFRNGPFEGNELALSLREDGSIDSFSYKRTKAPGPGAIGAANDAASQYQAYKDDQDKKAKDALTSARAAQIADLQYQIDLLTKKKELAKAGAPASIDPNQALIDETAAINAQTALLEAKLAKLKAEAAIAEASGT